VEPGHRRLLALLGVAVFFEGYGRSLPSVTLSYIGRDLAAPAAELSQALALIAAGALGVLVLGPLADGIGRRPVLLGCILLYGLLGAATASASALRQLVAWQAAARMFQEGALYAAAVAAAEEMPAAQRGIAQGLLGAANTLGAGLVALLFATVEHWPGGWRGLCVVNLAPLATLPFLGRGIPESRRWLEHRSRTAARLPPAYRARMLAALAVLFLGTSYDVAGFAFTAYLPMTAHGWSPGATSAMIVGAGGLGLPGWWVGGRLADRAGRRRTAILFLLGLTLAEVAFFLGGTRALWPAFGAMVFCAAGKTTVLRAWATELFPTGVRGTAAGWLSAGATLGGMTGLSVAGALAPALGGIEASLALVAGAGVAAAAAAAAWLPETSSLELEAIAPES
jgi:MFS family permease